MTIIIVWLNKSHAVRSTFVPSSLIERYIMGDIFG